MQKTTEAKTRSVVLRRSRLRAVSGFKHDWLYCSFETCTIVYCNHERCTISADKCHIYSPFLLQKTEKVQILRERREQATVARGKDVPEYTTDEVTTCDGGIQPKNQDGDFYIKSGSQRSPNYTQEVLIFIN